MRYNLGRTGITIAVCISMLGTLLVLTNEVEPPIGEAKGWESTSSNGKYVGTDYSTGYVRKYLYNNPPLYTLYRSSSLIVFDETVRNYYSQFQAWFEFDLPVLDDKVGLGPDTSVTLYRSSAYYQVVDVYLLDYDPDSVSTQDKFEKMEDSYKIGSIYISGAYHTLTFSKTARDYLQTKIRNGDSVGHIGIVGTGAYTTQFYAPNCYVTMSYDDEAPDTPVISTPDYVNSVELPLTWSAVDDNPDPGTGNVQYQIGYFDTMSSSTPYHTTEWMSDTSTTLSGLQDGKQYTMRIRAKDGNGYTTSWSAYDTVQPDVSPPTTPLVFDEPQYTNGTENELSFASTDAGIGIQYYAVIYATNPDFSDSGGEISYGSPFTHDSLISGSTYYYITYALDNFNQQSEYSRIVSTTMDDDPPTVPILMKEPPFTKGEENTYQWHPSIDEGIGIEHYRVQLATSFDFNSGSLVYDIKTNDTLATFDGLEDDTIYFARTKAVDMFHHESEWSEAEWSTQDHTGPGELGLTPLMEYLPEGPVQLKWEGAEDNGSGVAYYEVLWSTDPLFISNVHSFDHVLGQSFQIPDLDPGVKWYIKVRGYDSLDNPGEGETTFTTIDTIPPTQPIIEPLDEYTGGMTTNLIWSESTDSLSGLDHYMVNVYTSSDRIGLVFTVRTTELEYEIPGLADGTEYHYEVIAIDAAGNEIASALAHSTQDNRGPDTPSMLPMDTYQSTGTFRIEWGPSSDLSGGSIEYQVQWAEDILFTDEVYESPWLTGTNYIVHDISGSTRSDEGGKEPLDDGQYYVRVRSRDGFQQMSSFGNSMRIVIDTTSPSIPVIDELPKYSGGSRLHVSWEPSDDDGAGGIDYRVIVLENETGDPIMYSDWTTSTNIDITGLKADRTYYLKVIARDGLGFESDPSDAAVTTIDINGPLVTIDQSGMFGGDDLFLKGLVNDAGCGVEKVEVSFDSGQTWDDCTVVVDQWSYPMNLAPETATSFLVRGHDIGSNIGLAVTGYIDNTAPIVNILYPTEGARISGLTQITGSIIDDNLASYRVEYKRPGSEEWTSIVPEQSISTLSGILATWAPVDVPGGDYILMVTATDLLGQERSVRFNITMAGAILNIDPSQITFSNHNPLPGEEVTVTVTISNFGDSLAGDVTLMIFDDGKEIHSETGITVPANGIHTVTTTFKAEGEHHITARATSTLYDSGEMGDASTIETAEEEMVLENFGGIVGLIALILAIIALILAIVLKGKGKKDEEKKDDMESTEKEDPSKKTAPPMEMAKPASDKPTLPEPEKTQNQQPQLPDPTIAPTSAPGQTPQTQTSSQGAPQLKAAPPLTMENEGFKAAPPSDDQPKVNLP